MGRKDRTMIHIPSEPRVKEMWDRFTALGDIVGQGRHRTSIQLEDCTVKFPYGRMNCVGCSSDANDEELSWFEGDYPFPCARILVVDTIPAPSSPCNYYYGKTHTPGITIIVSETVKPCLVPIARGNCNAPEFNTAAADRTIRKLRKQFPWFNEAVSRGGIDCCQVGFTEEGELVVYDYGDPNAKRVGR
jgi:hypothetical protein